MLPDLLNSTRRFLLVVLAVSLPAHLAYGGETEFEKTTRIALAEIHAKGFAAGDMETCVSIYADNATFFVDNELQATGQKELLAFYRQLKEEDQILSIEVDEFVEFSQSENSGWVIFNYSKVYDLTSRDPDFLRQHKLTGFSSLRVRQYGTAIFNHDGGQWKIQTMLVFDPEVWEPHHRMRRIASR